MRFLHTFQFYDFVDTLVWRRQFRPTVAAVI
jgi:hypothetical protein